MANRLVTKVLSKVLFFIIVVNLLIINQVNGGQQIRLAVLGYDSSGEGNIDQELLNKIGISHQVIDLQTLEAEELSSFSVLIVQSNNYDYDDQIFRRNEGRITDFVQNGGILIVFPQFGHDSYDWLPVQVIVDEWIYGGDLEIETYHEILDGLSLNDFEHIYYSSPFEAIYSDCLVVLVEPTNGDAVLALVPYGKGMILLSSLKLDEYDETEENFEKALRIYRRLIEWSLGKPRIDEPVVPQNTILESKVYPHLLVKTCLQPCPVLLSRVLDIERIKSYVELQFSRWYRHSALHMLSISKGILTLRLLNETSPLENNLICRIQGFQKADGGFNFENSFNPNLSSNLQDTYFAVLSLATLGAVPKNTSGCTNYLSAQLQEDGSYGGDIYSQWQPYVGYYRHPINQAFYAVSSLRMLNANISRANTTAIFLERFCVEWGPFSGAFSKYPAEELEDQYSSEEYIDSLSDTLSFYAILTLEQLGSLPKNSSGLASYLANQTSSISLMSNPNPLMCLKILGQGTSPSDSLLISALNSTIKEIEFKVALQDLFDEVVTLSTIANYFPKTLESFVRPMELSLPNIEVEEYRMAVLDNANVEWDTEAYSQIGVQCDKISPFDLYSTKLEEYSVLVIPYTEREPNEFDEALRDNIGALARFVLSGGVLIVFPQEDGYYDWLPLPIEVEELPLHTVGVGNGALRSVRHEILANLTSLDFENWGYTWVTTFEKLSSDFTIVLGHDTPLLALCKFGKGTIVFTALIADYKAQVNPNAARVLRNIIIWSLENSHISSKILSVQSFADYVYMICVLFVLIFFVFVFFFDVFQRQPRDLLFLKKARRFLVRRYTFVTGLAIFALDYLLRIGFLKIILVSLIVYDIDLFSFMGFNEDVVSKKMKLISVAVTMSYSLAFAYAIYFVIPLAEGHGYLLLLSGMLLSVLSAFVIKSVSRFLFGLCTFQPEMSMILRTRRGNYASDGQWRRSASYFFGCYLLGVGIVTSILIVGISNPSEVYVIPSSLTLFITTTVFTTWGMVSVIGNKEPIGSTGVLLKMRGILLTPKGVIYGLLWLVLFVGGMQWFSSSLFQFIESLMISPQRIAEGIRQVSFVFYYVVFPSYLIYHLAEEHIMECDPKPSTPKKIVNPIPYLIMLFLYLPAVSLSQQLVWIYAYAGFILIPFWVLLATQSRNPSYSAFMIGLDSRLEDILLLSLISSYTASIILSMYLVEVSFLLFLAIGGLLAFFGLSFYVAQKLYLRKRLLPLRIFLFLGSLMVGVNVYPFAWWLYCLSLVQVVTILDVWGS